MVWKYFKDGRPPEWHLHPVGTVEGKRPRPPGPLERLRGREVWKAARRAVHHDDEVVYTDLPVHTVRFTYTDTWKCDNPEECQRLVWELQENHMAKYTYDIKWNFLVAPDGIVYEGRGWDFDAYRPMKYDKLKGKCIDIAYMGNYIDLGGLQASEFTVVNNNLFPCFAFPAFLNQVKRRVRERPRPVPKVMLEAAYDLIDWGVHNDKIICCYDSIPHTDPQVDDNNREPPVRTSFYNEYVTERSKKPNEQYSEVTFNKD